jgi:hypothetical protein
MSKLSFASKAQLVCNAIGNIYSDSEDLRSAYFDRGYNSGGGDPITDNDVQSLGITAADISSYITMAEQISNFIENLAVVQGDYGSTTNKMRNDI